MCVFMKSTGVKSISTENLYMSFNSGSSVIYLVGPHGSNRYCKINEVSWRSVPLCSVSSGSAEALKALLRYRKQANK